MLVEKLLACADKHPGRIAVRDPTRELSWADLARLADVLRRHIQKRTSCPRVGIMLPSSVGFAGAFYGGLWAGRTVIPLNFLLHPGELARVVQDAGIDTIFAIKHFAELLKPLPVQTVFLEELPLKRDMLLQRLRRKPSPPSVRPDDVAIILYTSGTSGEPKGVCLSYQNLASNADGCVAAARLSADHRFLGILPLFHTFGLTAMLLAPVAAGAMVSYMPRFSLPGVLSEIRERRISVMMAVASMYAALLRVKSATAEDWAPVVYAVSGGEALPDAVYHGFRERFGKTLVQGYGLTETSPVVSLDLPWAHRMGTVGRPLEGVRVQAYDDNNAPLTSGQTGELWVRGPNVMQGYYNKPAETAAVMVDGWFKTGDMGLVDADGYLTITGRKKELIIVGGENVYPREIESVLDQHPAVAESAVVGEMSAGRGEVVVGFVVPKEGMTVTDLELREFCRDKLANYKLPRRVIVRSDLPRGPTGKIFKRKLKDLL